MYGFLRLVVTSRSLVLGLNHIRIGIHDKINEIRTCQKTLFIFINSILITKNQSSKV